MLTIEEYNAGVREVTREEAESMTRRIRVAIDGTWELIRDAYLSRVWLPLGYESWDEYTDAEFGASRLRLPREERREAISSLRDAGLSLRAISSGLGVSKPTVIKDLRESEEVVKSLPPAPTAEAEPAPPAEAPAPRVVTGMDGKTYTPKPREVVDMQTGEVIEEAPKPRRRPLTDQSRTAGWDLVKAIERIERITQDDRFNTHKDQVATHLRSHLENAIDSCQGILDRINN